jgi:hypothetical protein
MTVAGCDNTLFKIMKLFIHLCQLHVNIKFTIESPRRSASAHCTRRV